MTVGLYIICKNERDVLPQLLASVEGAFDHIALTDTGSTDCTIGWFEDWCVEHRQRYSVHEYEWSGDFGAARQYALGCLERHGRTDWSVWCDADDTVDGIALLSTCLDAIDTQAPDANVVMMPYAWTPTFAGYHLRATRRGTARWAGRRHESLSAPGERITVDAVKWKTNRPGGHRDFAEDALALQEDLREDPSNARAQFYLAQTYKDMGAAPEAIEAYDARVRMGGWIEEVYYAAYTAGCLAADIGYPDWIARLLGAYEIRPARGEAPHALAARLREAKLYHAALHYAEVVMALPPNDDLLFVSTWQQAWGAQFEASICHYYCGNPERCLELSAELLERDDLPEEHREALRLNVEFARRCMPAV